MLTLSERIRRAASRQGGVCFVSGDRRRLVAWQELHEDAAELAGALRRRGIGAGCHVGLLGPTTREHLTLIQAVWLAGATLVVLPLPMRLGSLEEFAAQTRRRVVQARLDLVLVDPDLAPLVTPVPGDPPIVPYGELGTARPVAVEVDPDGLALLQFTSGSTEDPKGVMLTHRQVCANLDAIVEVTQLDPEDDVLVSWLPLYHDMGLVGFAMLPMTTACDLVLAAPQEFLAAPGRWMQWISEHRGTATAGPNFSWVLATRSLRSATGRLDLSRLRIALNGAEPVDPGAVEAFVAAGSPHGLAPGAVFPAFGMAEVVIAGTFPEPGRGLVVDAVDREALERDGRADPSAGPGALRLTRLGRPVPGLQMRVVDPEVGSPLGERRVGELELRGASVTAGYYGRPDVDAFRDGWLRTGDLAYVADGELVVCGRIKDVIIVGGRNLFPDEIERAAGGVAGVRAGNVVAFGVPGPRGREAVVVVAEHRGEDPDGTSRHVAERVRGAVGVAPRDVVLVAPRSLPKTSSGKLQRGACRQLYLDGLWGPERLRAGWRERSTT